MARMPMRRIALFLAVLLSLSACQKPTSYTPQLSPEELAAERARQEQMLQHSKAQGGAPKNWRQKGDMRSQFERVAAKVETSGADMCRALGLAEKRNCYFYFDMDKGDEINAQADGERITVSAGMMRFIEDDAELALVLSHEMTHNLMGHVGSKKVNAAAGAFLGLVVDVLAASQGVNTSGGFTQTGMDVGGISYSSEFEREADYIGLYIMAGAGYDISKTPNFWRRLTIAEPGGMYGGNSHPSNPERFVAMQKTVDEIAYKRRQGIVLLPDFKENVTD